MFLAGIQYYGIWLSINNNKTFSGGSSVASDTELYASGSNTLSFKYISSNYDTVTFINNVFYLTTDASNYFNMEASGNSIRINTSYGFAGAWISLT